MSIYLGFFLGPDCLTYANGPNWQGTKLEHLNNVESIYDCLLKCYVR